MKEYRLRAHHGMCYAILEIKIREWIKLERRQYDN